MPDLWPVVSHIRREEYTGRYDFNIRIPNYNLISYNTISVDMKVEYRILPKDNLKSWFEKEKSFRTQCSKK